MKPKAGVWRGVLLDFHRDEGGMEAIQVVLIVAIAAIVLVFLKSVLWPRIKNWVNEQVDNLTN